MTKKKKPEEKQKVGRKNVITAEIKAQIKKAVSIGATFAQAREFACINGHPIAERTFFTYLKEHPEFRQELEYLKKNPVLKAKNTIYNNLNNPKWAAWYLERKNPEEFAKTDKIKLQGNLDANVSTDDDLKSLIAGIIELNKLNGMEVSPEELIQMAKEEELAESKNKAEETETGDIG